MTKRMISMLAAIAVVIAALATVKFHQIKVAIAQASSFQPPPEAVTTVVAKRQAWPDTLEAIGSVAAVQGVTVAADLPGLVDASPSTPAARCGRARSWSSWTRARRRRSWPRPWPSSS